MLGRAMIMQHPQTHLVSSTDQVALLEVPPVAGAPVRMSTGVMVIYVDDESFTFMTPEGHAFSAWITS